MYISTIHITHYRCFTNTTIDFEPGVTVIIGENNAGKTSLLRAVALVLERSERDRPTIDDFAQTLPASDVSPRISVAVSLRSSDEDTLMDRALVSTWLTKIAAPWEAQLTYEFFLPAEHEAEFHKNAGETPTIESFRRAVQLLLPKYVARTWAGDPKDQRRAEPDLLDKIDFQSLNALRDVESDMFRGRSALLRSVLLEILDRQPAHKAAAAANRQAFSKAASSLVGGLIDRLDQSSLFSLVAQTGAKDGGTPKLGGALSERDVLAALLLLLERHGFSVPASHIGLGYNNLIYIALVLAQIEFTSSDRQGQNAHVFPLLAIEEPEAHLHPSMQYKLLRYLKNRLADQKSSRQIFITTHSTHVTAATPLDSLICMSLTEKGAVHVSYPGKTFPTTNEGKKSKAYVERYLDATKSAMLFAKSVIFVEGLAENILLPVLAEYLASPLEEHHVAVVPVGGLTFQHFLPLFGCGAEPSKQELTLQRRVACLVDADPARRERISGKWWYACFHYEIDIDTDRYEYRPNSPTLARLQELAINNPRIFISPGRQTLEYDLALCNVDNQLLLGNLRVPTGSTPSAEVASISPLSALGPELEAAIEARAKQGDLSAAAMQFASRYRKSIGEEKGLHAFELERRLRDNLALKDSARGEFMVPKYIEDAISWVSRTVEPSSQPATP